MRPTLWPVGRRAGRTELYSVRPTFHDIHLPLTLRPHHLPHNIKRPPAIKPITPTTSDDPTPLNTRSPEAPLAGDETIVEVAEGLVVELPLGVPEAEPELCGVDEPVALGAVEPEAEPEAAGVLAGTPVAPAVGIVRVTLALRQSCWATASVSV